MPHDTYNEYRIKRDAIGNMPHFTDFSDPRFSFATASHSGNKTRVGEQMYMQWLHCIGNWGEDHSTCQKLRWYVERTLPENLRRIYDEKKAIGRYDYTILYGAKPWPGFEPLYQPVKKNHKGAYEFWKDRDFEQIIEPEAANYKEVAPILQDIWVHGKKPVFD